MKQLMPVMLVSCLAIALVTYFQGNESERWTKFPELRAYGERLQSIPLEIGEWKGVKDQEPSKSVIEISGSQGQIDRVYTNARTQERIAVMVMCGRQADLFGHPPSLCYPSGGWTPEFEGREIVINLPKLEPAEFQYSHYRKSDAGINQGDRIFFAYSAPGEKWQNPSNPKLALGAKRALYKCYVHRDISGKSTEQLDAERIENDPCVQFLQAFLPEVHAAAIDDHDN
jgi:hypothetical protein